MLLSIKGYFTRRLLGESAIKDKQLVTNHLLSPGLTSKHDNWLSLDRIKIEIAFKVQALETPSSKRQTKENIKELSVFSRVSLSHCFELRLYSKQL